MAYLRLLGKSFRFSFGKYRFGKFGNESTPQPIHKHVGNNFALLKTMIKFFGKIRKKMLTKNKFGKYLIYAIGEITLVVIGILIALQVNKWKENQAEIKQQNVILSNLNLELNNNLKNLKAAIEFSEMQINSSENLLLSMNNLKTNTYKGEKLDSLLSHLTFSKWNRSNLNIKSLESSGSLNAVENIELKKLIYDWMNQIEELEILEKRSDYAVQYHVDFIKKNGSWREIDKYMLPRVKGSQLLPSNDHLLMSPEFENCVNDLNIFETHKYNMYQRIMVKLSQLIEYTE